MLDWCFYIFGKSKYKASPPKLQVVKEGDDCGGYHFEKNIITIYLGSHNTVLELTSTIIHEYAHYLQDENIYNFYEGFDVAYKKHPYEIEAEEFSFKHTEKCYEALIIKFKI